MIGIVDYGLGNVQAFANIYKRLGVQCRIAQTPEELSKATRIILPGVGSFDWAMEKLEHSGMRNTLDKMVLDKGVSVLGVCVGMQIMAQRSDEGNSLGLGWMNAEVKRFEQPEEKILRLPHMGWNDVTPLKSDKLFQNLSDPRFYFLHSYYFSPHSPQLSLASSRYEIDFTSAVSERNIMGVQFHPEKSHHWGIRLLENFSEV